MSFLTNFEPIAAALAAADRYDLALRYEETGLAIDEVDALLAENAAAHAAEVERANAAATDAMAASGLRPSPQARAELFAYADLLAQQRADLLARREDLLSHAVTLEDEMQPIVNATAQMAA